LVVVVADLELLLGQELLVAQVVLVVVVVTLAVAHLALEELQHLDKVLLVVLVILLLILVAEVERVKQETLMDKVMVEMVLLPTHHGELQLDKVRM
jgi:hypothetical protein